MIVLTGLFRFSHELILMVLFGSAVLLTLLKLPLPGWDGRRIAALTALLCGLLWFYLTTMQMAGGAADPHMVWLALTQTSFGLTFALRLVLLVLLCAALWFGWRESLVALFSGAALALIGVTSHAAEFSPAHFTAIGAVSDGLHLLTGGFWIGGLVLLRAIYARARPGFAAAVRRFAETAMIAVAVLILTGMLNATTILLGQESSLSPLYLAVLGTKLVLVLAMLALAMVNHFRLLPQVPESGATRLSSNIGWELRLGLVVVGLAVALALLAPAMG